MNPLMPKGVEHTREKRLEKCLDEAVSALKVIYTCADFERGAALDPEPTVKPIRKPLVF